LTQAEEGALQLFAREHGRQWKQALRDEWMRERTNTWATLAVSASAKQGIPQPKPWGKT
jgi:hypothetical protein